MVPPHIKNSFLDSSRYFPTQLQQFQFYDKYSRFNYNTGRRETWSETVDRVITHLKKLSNAKLSSGDYNKIQNFILNMKSMPSMRLVAMAGEAAQRDGTSSYNCSAIGVDSIETFAEALLISMAGCGVGFSVEKRFVSKLPKVEFQTGSVSTWIVPDSSEGWGETIRYCFNEWFNGTDVNIDYSQVRPAGAVLKTKGGRASGPHPLMNTMSFAKDKILSAQGRQLTSLEAHDIMCMVGQAAISGGVRRTAMISLFDFDDMEMATCKNDENMLIFDEEGSYVGDKNTQRWNANNSAVWPDRKLNYYEVKGFVQNMHDSGRGEPGIFNRYAPIPKRRERNEFLTNPCLTGDTLIYTTSGVKSFSEIEGLNNVMVYCIDNNGDITIRFMDNPRVTEYAAPVYITTLSCGKSVRSTYSHKFMTRNNEYKELNKIGVGGVIAIWNSNTKIIEESIILSIEKDGYEDVYNGTVDEYHNYLIADNNNSKYIISKNCGEINLKNRQFCNLSMAIARQDDTFETLKEKVEVAAIIGTIQSMETNFPYLKHPDWVINSEKERLLGVDINGQMDAINLLDKNVFEKLKELAIETNKKYAQKLGIAQAASVTCVKPSGNSSVLLDCSAGLHNRWSRYYIRNVRVDGHSPMYKVLKKSGVPMTPENGQTKENAIAWVVSFPVKSPEGAVTNGERTAIEQLDWWKINKLYWTEHNPSVTITYDPHELHDIVDWVYTNQEFVGGISFLPKSNHHFEQAPYISISKQEYDRRVSEFPEIDFSLLYEYEDTDMTTAAQELACSGGFCDII